MPYDQNSDSDYLDPVERELELAIQEAASKGDDSLAYELSVDLINYQNHYKTC